MHGSAEGGRVSPSPNPLQICAILGHAPFLRPALTSNLWSVWYLVKGTCGICIQLNTVAFLFDPAGGGRVYYPSVTLKIQSSF